MRVVYNVCLTGFRSQTFRNQTRDECGMGRGGEGRKDIVFTGLRDNWMWVNDERDTLLHTSPIIFPWEYDISNLLRKSYISYNDFVIRDTCIENIDDNKFSKRNLVLFDRFNPIIWIMDRWKTFLKNFFKFSSHSDDAFASSVDICFLTAFEQHTVAPANESTHSRNRERRQGADNREAFAGPMTADRRWFADNSGEKGYGRVSCRDNGHVAIACCGWQLTPSDTWQDKRGSSNATLSRTRIISVEMSGTGNVAWRMYRLHLICLFPNDRIVPIIIYISISFMDNWNYLVHLLTNKLDIKSKNLNSFVPLEQIFLYFKKRFDHISTTNVSIN